jgi:ribosomal protein S18 acetylase RimI-like enzyme
VTATPLAGEQTLVASWRALASTSPGATVLDGEGSVAAVFPAWLPLNNAIGRVPPSHLEATTAEVERLTRVYDDAGVTEWAYWLPSNRATFEAPDRHQVSNARRGETTLVMRADLVDGLRTTGDAVRTSVTGAADAGDAPLAVEDLDTPAGGAIEGWVMVRDGLAVAGLWSCIHDDDCGIYTVGTAPEWRRREVARALVEHALADARARGARTASLQSTPMAVRLYESLGFRAVGRYEEWVIDTVDRRR